MVSFLYLGSIVVLSYISKYSCEILGKCNQDTLLDFVLVQDTTGSYMNTWPVLIEAMTSVTEELLEDFPQARFGLSIFSDYGELYPYPDLRDKCYDFALELSSRDRFLLELSELSKYNRGGDDVPESSFTAMALALQDARFNWRQSNETQNVLRVMVMATDAASHQSTSRTNHYPDMKFDGTDSCANNSPTTDSLGTLMKDKNVFMVGLIEGKAIGTWKNYLDQFQLAGAKGIVRGISVKDKLDITKQLLEGVKEACEEFIPEEPQLSEPPPPFSETEPQTSPEPALELLNNRFPTEIVVGAAAGTIVLAALIAAGVYASASRKSGVSANDFDINEEQEDYANPEDDREWMTNVDEGAYE